MSQPFRERVKWTVRRTLKQRGWTIRRQPTLIDFLASRKVDLVVDVGANVGRFASELREWGYAGRIVSFEPGAKAFSVLTHLAEGDARWEPRRSAMGRAPGVVTLDVARSTVSSPVRSQADATRAYGNDADVIGQEEVEIDSLDRFLSTRAERSIFIKVDTQGFEPEVVAGLTRHFDRVAGVQMELPIIQLCQDDWTLAEALETMRAKGFEIAQVGAVNQIRDDPVSATELDCVFRRATG